MSSDKTARRTGRESLELILEHLESFERSYPQVNVEYVVKRLTHIVQSSLEVLPDEVKAETRRCSCERTVDPDNDRRGDGRQCLVCGGDMIGKPLRCAKHGEASTEDGYDRVGQRKSDIVQEVAREIQGVATDSKTIRVSVHVVRLGDWASRLLSCGDGETVSCVECKQNDNCPGFEDCPWLASSHPAVPAEVWAIIMDGLGQVIEIHTSRDSAKEAAEKLKFVHLKRYPLHGAPPQQDGEREKCAGLRASAAALERIKIALRRPGTDRSYVDWAAECRAAVDQLNDFQNGNSSSEQPATAEVWAVQVKPCDPVYFATKRDAVEYVSAAGPVADMHRVPVHGTPPQKECPAASTGDKSVQYASPRYSEGFDPREAGTPTTRQDRCDCDQQCHSDCTGDVSHRYCENCYQAMMAETLEAGKRRRGGETESTRVNEECACVDGKCLDGHCWDPVLVPTRRDSNEECEIRYNPKTKSSGVFAKDSKCTWGTSPDGGDATCVVCDEREKCEPTKPCKQCRDAYDEWWCSMCDECMAFDNVGKNTICDACLKETQDECTACLWYSTFMSAVAGALPREEYERVVKITQNVTGKPSPHGVEAMTSASTRKSTITPEEVQAAMDKPVDPTLRENLDKTFRTAAPNIRLKASSRVNSCRVCGAPAVGDLCTLCLVPVCAHGRPASGLCPHCIGVPKQDDDGVHVVENGGQTEAALRRALYGVGTKCTCDDNCDSVCPVHAQKVVNELRYALERAKEDRKMYSNAAKARLDAFTAANNQVEKLKASLAEVRLKLEESQATVRRLSVSVNRSSK